MKQRMPLYCTPGLLWVSHDILSEMYMSWRVDTGFVSFLRSAQFWPEAQEKWPFKQDFFCKDLQRKMWDNKNDRNPKITSDFYPKIWIFNKNRNFCVLNCLFEKRG